MIIVLIYVLIGVVLSLVNSKKIIKDFDAAEIKIYKYYLANEETNDLPVKLVKAVAKFSIFLGGLYNIILWPRSVYDYNIKPILKKTRK